MLQQLTRRPGRSSSCHPKIEVVVTLKLPQNAPQTIAGNRKTWKTLCVHHTNTSKCICLTIWLLWQEEMCFHTSNRTCTPFTFTMRSWTRTFIVRIQHMFWTSKNPSKKKKRLQFKSRTFGHKRVFPDFVPNFKHFLYFKFKFKRFYWHHFPGTFRLVRFHPTVVDITRLPGRKAGTLAIPLGQQTGVLNLGALLLRLKLSPVSV